MCQLVDLEAPAHSAVGRPTVRVITSGTTAPPPTVKPVCFLRRKDPSAFFSFPVTDLIAPGYSLVIRQPMDFSTIKEKVKNDYYQSLDELKVCVCWYGCCIPSRATQQDK